MLGCEVLGSKPEAPYAQGQPSEPHFQPVLTQLNIAFLNFNFMCIGVCTLVRLNPKRPEEGATALEIGATDGYE